MAIVVVGGQSRKVGKTTMVAGLIAALPEYRWTAFKISLHRHGGRWKGDGLGNGAPDRHTWEVSEEKDRSGDADTSRFLAAGAERVWRVRAQAGRFGDVMPAIRERMLFPGNVIFESNSVLGFLNPDLYLTVLDPQNEDFKPSAREFLGRADAVILHHSDGLPVWQGVSLEDIRQIPAFLIRPPEYVTSEIVEFVRLKISTQTRSVD